ncbi:hypothetical protein EVAR_96701_1 [Eumeta japonica]|uniref:Nucleic-acid-binding protein from transposon X-element n=1 Tax=Eumeta variegata TaxID=151549 RepID=A0A4C1WK29_EUMVA|nr:hypothetical protein EVAR_96701_1 [Eumeta japonica]
MEGRSRTSTLAVPSTRLSHLFLLAKMIAFYTPIFGIRNFATREQLFFGRCSSSGQPRLPLPVYAATTNATPVNSTAIQNTISASTQAVTDKTAPRMSAKPITPPRSKMPSPISLRKGANFLKVSEDCTRLRINNTKAVRTADNCTKILCSDVEIFRSRNKYLVGIKVQFHTYALEEERKLKASAAFQPIFRNGSPLWLVLAVLPRTEKARKIFRNLNRVCGLSDIRVEVSHKRGDLGQCHCCQLYDHAATNCNVDPRCVKCLVSHWARECPRTRESEEKPSCHLLRTLINFPDNKPTPPVASSHSASIPSNPWVKMKSTLPQRPLRDRSGTLTDASYLYRFCDRGPLIDWKRHPNSDGRSPSC